MTQVINHRWNRRALAVDCVRGALSLGVSILFLMSLETWGTVFIGVLCVSVLFGFYLAESVSRLGSVVTVDGEGICVSGRFFGDRRMKWTELEQFELRHFSLSKIRKSGWMDLKLKGGKTNILVDDRLDGFDGVVRQAWAAAQAQGLMVSETTMTNLIASGCVEARTTRS